MLIGQTLGPYRVLEKLGEGGMGQVFRARDTKLNRDVALKVLPDSFANDADRLARFTREAQTLASLNHPNIAHIHGLEESDGVRALVMELVEGEDLSQLIARLRAPGASAGRSATADLANDQGARAQSREPGAGGLPVEDVLNIARQIAEAFEAAHEQGIIHRDLKPANIKVRSDGVVKVLDFGLAKALAPASAPGASAGQAHVSQSPTITTPAHLRDGYGGQAMTQAGMILGTAAYMSPEQARGKPVDKRADVWAFGVVVYEMITGQRLFKGEETSDVLAAVLRQDVDWTLLPAETPEGLRRLLARCLKKDAKTRLRDIGEARVQIEELLNGAADGGTDVLKVQGADPRAQSLKPVARWPQMLPWAVATAALAAAVTLWAPWRVETPVDRPLSPGRRPRRGRVPADDRREQRQQHHHLSGWYAAGLRLG